jgi:hypothetical protein
VIAASQDADGPGERPAAQLGVDCVPASQGFGMSAFTIGCCCSGKGGLDGLVTTLH